MGYLIIQIWYLYLTQNFLIHYDTYVQENNINWWFFLALDKLIISKWKQLKKHSSNSEMSTEYFVLAPLKYLKLSDYMS